MYEGTGIGTANDLWKLEHWAQQFPRRSSLPMELELLERLFPFEWRFDSLSEPKSKHQLRGDLMTPGGRTRVLGLAAELQRLIDQTGASRIPAQGRLRCWSLYPPTKSELLVSPILRSIGHVTWQPEGAGHGADYRVSDASHVLVAEVKRVCTSVRQDQATINRVLASMAGSGPVFTPEERVANTREDARRLYPRVRHAAAQIEHSRTKAARCFCRRASSVPGILFLDLDGNPYLINVRQSILRWMQRPWAHSIDLVLFFDYGCRDDAWGTIAEPIYMRTHRAFDALSRELPVCTRGHFHVGNMPSTECEFPLPL